MGECYLHTVEVVGSNPIPPTIYSKGLQRIYSVSPFFMVKGEITLGQNRIDALAAKAAECGGWPPK